MARASTLPQPRRALAGDAYRFDEVIQSIRWACPRAGHWLNWGINRRLAPLLNGDPAPTDCFTDSFTAFQACPACITAMSWGLWTLAADRDRTAPRWPGRLPATVAFLGSRPFAGASPDHSSGYDYRAVNVEVQKQLPGSLLNWHRRMLTCRRLPPALAHGSFQLLPCSHPGALSFRH